MFLPGWEEGLFPNQRALDESGQAGLEEERRLAYVGLTRARRRAKISFATQPPHPRHVAVDDPLALRRRTARGACGGDGGAPRISAATAAAADFDRVTPFGSTYDTPGWRRAQGRTQGGGGTGGGGFGGGSGGFSDRTGSYDSGPATRRSGPLLIEGELVAKSTGTDSAFGTGQRVFHVKFGNGTIAAVDGNKLTIDFDKAGRKMVLDSFVKGV